MRSNQSVTEERLTDADIQEAEQSWENNPELILRLVDLIFMGKERDAYPS